MCENFYTQCKIENPQSPCLCLRNYSFCLHWNPECPESDKSNLPNVCESSGCTIINCSDIKIPNFNCAACGNQYYFCLNETYQNATTLMSPIDRKCFCLNRLEDCLDQLGCSNPVYLLDTCHDWGSICAKNGTFLCDEEDYDYSPPTSRIIREIIEDRINEFQYYWSKRIIGLLQVQIQNFKEDSSQLSTIDIIYEYDPNFGDKILEQLRESIADDLSISINRISVIGTVEDTSKRNILATQNATIKLIDTSSALPLLTSWWSLLIFLLLLSL